MKIKLDKKDSKIVKDNKTYTLLDNTTLNNLVVSKTILHPGQETNGHKHEGQEEVYQFISGHGKMEVNPEYIRGAAFFVQSDDTVLIPDGYFHKVWNESETEDLIFICVFDGSRNH
tara:strand:- start:652 stop:999 length:348 start_codon:yes stop_codon:yes gene_type:complete